MILDITHIKQKVSHPCPKFPVDKSYTNFTLMFMDMEFKNYMSNSCGGHHSVIFVLPVPVAKEMEMPSSAMAFSSQNFNIPCQGLFTGHYAVNTASS